MKSNRSWGITLTVLVLAVLMGSVPVSADPVANSSKPRYGGPGTIVTIYGRNLGTYNKDCKVLFGSANARVISWEGDRVQAVIPGDVPQADVVVEGRRKKTVVPVFLVTAAGVRVKGPHFDMVPGIKKLSPRRGGPGRQVNVAGRNFGDYADLGKVMVGSAIVKVTQWQAIGVKFIMPDSFKPGDVKLEKDRRGREKRYVEVRVKAGGLTSPPQRYYLETALNGYSPKHPSPSQRVTLKGRGLGKSVESVRVFAGNIEVKPVSVDGSQVVFDLPSTIKRTSLHRGSLPVRVEAAGVMTNRLMIPVSPVIKRIRPVRGYGNGVVLSGEGFGRPESGQVIITDGTKNYKGVVKTWTQDGITFDFPPSLKGNGRDRECQVLIKVFDLKSNLVDYSFKGSVMHKEKKPEKTENGDKK